MKLTLNVVIIEVIKTLFTIESRLIITNCYQINLRKYSTLIVFFWENYRTKYFEIDKTNPQNCYCINVHSCACVCTFVCVFMFVFTINWSVSIIIKNKWFSNFFCMSLNNEAWRSMTIMHDWDVQYVDQNIFFLCKQIFLLYIE